MNLMSTFYIFITALFASLIMVPFLRKWALNSGTVDVPDERKVHKGAIPRLGGVAIAMSTILSLLIHGNIDPQIRGIMAGAMVMFFTGMVDDLHGISPKRKFLGEIGASLITITVGHLYISQLGNLFGFGEIVLPIWVGVPFTLIAVVGLINAINLIDGLDGLAGGVSVIVLVTFGLLGYLSGNTPVILISAALLGGILGFLKYNFYPARIFMGDAGSLTVGFVLAFLAILLTQAGSSVSPVVPVIVLGLPIVDTLYVMTRRTLHGGSPFAPDKGHVHHKFLDLGFDHRFTVIIIYGISFFWALIGIVCRQCPEFFLLGLYVSISAACYISLRHILRNQERFDWLLSFDSHQAWKHSQTYKRMADFFSSFETLLFILLVIFVSVASLFGMRMNQDLLPFFFGLSVCMVALLYFTRNLRTDFNLLTFYFVALLFTGLLYFRYSEMEPLFRAGVDSLFLVIAGLTFLRLFFRRPGNLFLSSADLLVFGINILFAVFASQLQDHSAVPDILARSVILYFAIKIVLVGSEKRTKPIAWALFSAMMVMLGRVVLV